MTLAISSYDTVYWIDHVDHYFWQYPAHGQDHQSALYVNSKRQLGPPPSETLKSLIAAKAPPYVVVERFCEEYPDWADAVLGWYWASQPAEVPA